MGHLRLYLSQTESHQVFGSLAASLHINFRKVQPPIPLPSAKDNTRPKITAGLDNYQRAIGELYLGQASSLLLLKNHSSSLCNSTLVDISSASVAKSNPPHLGQGWDQLGVWLVGHSYTIRIVYSCEKKAWKIRLAGTRTLTSAIPVQRSNQLS